MTLLVMMVALASLAGCGKSAMEQQQEYYQKQTALNTFDVQQVLAGRDPSQVLETVLSGGGCVWLEKGLLGTGSENRTVALGAVHDRESNHLRLEKFYEYNWGLGKVHRTTSVADIPLDHLKSFVRPPTHDGPYQCWTLHFSCREGDCVQYEKRHQLIGSTSVSDDGSESGRTVYWTLKFSDPDKAVEACAALRALSGDAR